MFVCFEDRNWAVKWIDRKDCIWKLNIIGGLSAARVTLNTDFDTNLVCYWITPFPLLISSSTSILLSCTDFLQVHHTHLWPDDLQVESGLNCTFIIIIINQSQTLVRTWNRALITRLQLNVAFWFYSRSLWSACLKRSCIKVENHINHYRIVSLLY